MNITYESFYQFDKRLKIIYRYIKVSLMRITNKNGGI